MTTRIWDLIPDSVPQEERERWFNLLLERGEAALDELRESHPELATAIDALLSKRQKSMSRTLYGDEGDEL